MENQNVVLFDGVCNLCNSSVQFLINHDKKNHLKFAALQSDFGQQVLQQHNFDSQNFDTFLYLKNDQLYTKSTAALKVLKDIGGGWSILYGFIVIPSFIRNSIYSFVANHRYQWFGKMESCMMPTPELKAKFID